MNDTTLRHIEFAAKIVAAYLSHNKIKPDEIPPLLHGVSDAIVGLSERATAVAKGQAPAVPINKSVTPNRIICLEDGKKVTMLKRYLRTNYELSPEEYRRKWGLPDDYPMTAPNYSKRRSELAKNIGLGRVPLKKRRSDGC